MRAVMAGCGRMSRTWLEAAARIEDLRIVGLVDLDPTLAASVAARHGLADAAIGNDLSAMLRDTAPDAVFDVVVPDARAAVVTTALQAGCHVLSEKPMAASMAEAQSLVAAARRAARIHAVVQNRRYIPGVRRLRRFLACGALGTVHGVHCDFFLGPHFGGFRETMSHVLLLDMAIHTFDVARLLCGANPHSVSCVEWNPAGSWYADGACAIAIFTMQNGTVFSYRGSWCAEGLQTSWEAAWRIIGTGGTLTWDGAEAMSCETLAGARNDGDLFAPTRPITIPPLDPSDRIGGHLGVMQDFVAAVRGGAEPETVGHENIRSLGMVFGAIDSAQTGRTVEINEREARPGGSAPWTPAGGRRPQTP